MNSMRSLRNRIKTAEISRYLLIATMTAGAAVEVWYMILYPLGGFDYVIGILACTACLIAIRHTHLGLTIICLIAATEGVIPWTTNFLFVQDMALIAPGILAARRPLWIAGVNWVIVVLGSGYQLYLISGSLHSFVKITLVSFIPITIGILFLLLKESNTAEIMAAEARWLRYRNSLAEDIHDSVTHSLVQIKLLSELRGNGESEDCSSEISKISGEALNQLQNLTAHVREGYEMPEETREPRSLAETLKRITQESESVGMRVDTEIIGDVGLITARVESEIAQICLEISTNMLKHAQHNKLAQILVKISTEKIRIYSSNAIENEIGEAFPSNHQGTGNMTARVERLGGRIHTNSIEGLWNVSIIIPNKINQIS